MMSGFENFDIRAWVADGLLTRHVADSARAKPRPKRGNHLSLIAFPLASAVAAFHLLVGQASAQTSVNLEASILRRWQNESTDSDLIKGDPKQYWGHMLSLLHKRMPIDESSVPDPDPFF